MMKKLTIISVLSLFMATMLLAQDNILQHEISYSTTHQDMWGSGDAFSLEMDVELIPEVVLDEHLQPTIDLSPFGSAQLDFHVWAYLSSMFSIHGFTLGSVDVDYPVQITLDFPDDYSFDHGQTVTINSDYTVRDGWALDTHFPTAGVISLDFEYGFGVSADFIFSLPLINTNITIPLIPTLAVPVDPRPENMLPVPHDSVAIFYLNSQTGEVAYPCMDQNTGNITICHDNFLPIIIPDFFNIGMTAEITIPYVITEDSYDPATRCLHATGDSAWLTINVNLVTFLGFLAGLLPDPEGTALQQIIGMLEGDTIVFEQDIGIGQIRAAIEYMILRANLSITANLVQEFDFCPTILATLQFPISLPYSETDPANGDAVVAEGDSDRITFAVTNDLNITYPCYDPDSLEVQSVTYNITSGFRNHTYNHIDIDVMLQVLLFHFSLDIESPLLSTHTIPSFELPPLYVDNADLGRQRLVVSSPAIEMDVPNLDDYVVYNTKGGNQAKRNLLNLCFPTDCHPLIDSVFDIVDFDLPLLEYDQTWNLEGFEQDIVFPGTWLRPRPRLDIDVNAHDVICYGDSTGSVIVTAVNSTGDYTFDYAWGANTLQHVHAERQDSINGAAGYYFITLTDVYGCSVTDEINVSDENPPIISSLSSDEVLCYGEATGNLYAEVSGGVPPYTYLWQPSGSTNQYPAGVLAGWHTVTITDDVGCEHVDSVFVNQPDAPLSIRDTAGMVSCHGLSDGFIRVTVEGGTMPYRYYWSNGQMTADLMNIPAGAYTVTVIDAHQCEIRLTDVITEPDPLVLSTYTQDVLCYGEATGAVDLVVEGGTTPYSYEWNNGATSQDLHDVLHGLYIVTVTDANGCEAFTMVQISQPDLPLTGDIEPTHVRCFGEGNGAADLTVWGGTPPYFYEWSNGEISEDILNLGPGIYSVTINDEHGCVASDTVQITQADAPMSGTITGTDAKCNGAADGNIYITASGGIPPYHYEWSNGLWQENLTGVTAGTYTVTVSDRNFCHYTMTYTVGQPDPFYIQVMDPPTICMGMDTTIGIAIITGSVPPYHYEWNTAVPPIDFGPTCHVSPSQTTTYRASVTDAAGCVAEDVEITVTVHKPITINVESSDSIVCPNTPVTFTVEINGGGVTGNNVKVNDSIVELPDSHLYDVNIQTDTIFTFVAYDSCMFDSASVSVPVHTHPLPSSVAVVEGESVGCSPLTVRFRADLTDTTSSMHRWVWNFDDGDTENLSEARSPEHTFYNPRTYHVRLRTTDLTTKCVADTTVHVIVHPLPEADFLTNSTTLNMTNPNVVFTNQSRGGYWYTWNFGDGVQSDLINPTHKYTAPGVYHVGLFVTSLYGCHDSTGVDISVSNELTIYAPTAFTPNYDGVNETFRIFADGVDSTTYKMSIYDRWGEKVFESEDYNEEWDGTLGKGIDCHEGVYVWIVTLKDLFGNEYKRSGNVTLLR